MERRSYSYEEVIALCRAGGYPSCVARAASGRINRLIGVDRARLEALRGEARRARVGVVVLGSRVSGPRSRQRSLHPALAQCLPLSARRRAPSALYQGSEGVEIEKDSIKDFGLEDPRTSDLSLILVDAARSREELEALARDWEASLAGRGWGFPVRVFAGLHGRTFRSEAQFCAVNADYLRSLSAVPLDPAEVREASRELYLTLNLPRRWFNLGDLRNGLLTAAMASVSLSLAFGFHAAFPAVAFAFGFCGRYLARLRAGLAFRWGDGWIGNGAALCLDAAIGAATMGGLIGPLAGFRVPFARLAAGAASGTLGRGGLRLFLDKKFSTGHEKRQGLGVAVTTIIIGAEGIVASFFYAGARWAQALQWALAAGGLVLIFGPILLRSAKIRIGMMSTCDLGSTTA